MLTKAQVKNYLHHPHQCPYCQSTNIEADTLETCDNEAFQDVSCHKCRAIWRDWYTLTDAEEMSPPVRTETDDLLQATTYSAPLHTYEED